MPILKKYLLSLPIGVMLFAPTLSYADIKCECRYFGNYVPLGSQICMNTPTGAKMAKCEMMQNNPSWQIEEDECPLAFNMSLTSETLTELALRLR